MQPALLHDHRARVSVGFHATDVNRVPVGARLVELDLATAVADVKLDSVIALERHVRVPATRRVDERDLFSDLNQWLLKALVGWKLPVGMISVPRDRARSAADLAERAACRAGSR